MLRPSQTSVSATSQAEGFVGKDTGTPTNLFNAWAVLPASPISLLTLLLTRYLLKLHACSCVVQFSKLVCPSHLCDELDSGPSIALTCVVPQVASVTGTSPCLYRYPARC